MPTYQLGAQYPHDYVKKLDKVLRFLPRPADYLFLYFIAIYILFMVLKIDYRLAFVGHWLLDFPPTSLLFWAWAIMPRHMPLLICHSCWPVLFLPFKESTGKAFTYHGSYGTGAGGQSHSKWPTTCFIGGVVGVAYLVDAFRKKQLPHYFKAVGIMALAVVLALGLNATNLLATQEYAATSTVGRANSPSIRMVP